TLFYLFFFSSRRRHTRFSRDWSSDVCSYDLDDAIHDLPATEREAVRLMRDVTVTNQLYLLLLNKAQELKVMQAGTVGNARIIDKIGRASCRERVKVPMDGGCIEEKITERLCQ